MAPELGGRVVGLVRRHAFGAACPEAHQPGRPSSAIGGPPVTAADPTVSGGTITTITDPVKVFQAAFWRRPSAEDVILNAERREWNAPAPHANPPSASGPGFGSTSRNPPSAAATISPDPGNTPPPAAAPAVRKWQWFLAVKPGPALKTWLETNPFLLSDHPASPQTTAVLPPEDPSGRSPAPDWFPKKTDGFRIQKHHAGSLTFLFSEEGGGTLYATDTGGGFH